MLIMIPILETIIRDIKDAIMLLSRGYLQVNDSFGRNPSTG